jgi:hemoglobin
VTGSPPDEGHAGPASTAAADPPLAATFFARAGGEPAIRRVVSELYEQLFDDLMVGFLFQGHDRQRIIDQQTLFTSRMLGADFAYTGKPLPEAHASSPILPGHFDRRHHLLRQILETSGFEASAREAWLRLDLALRPVILKQGQVRIEELRQVRLRNRRAPPRDAEAQRPQTPNAAAVSGSIVAGSRTSFTPPIVTASWS